MSKLGLRTSASQKGFTLIEMSIVLVIIGLIIGGILKGQEVIESSRQKNLITQIDGIRSAVNTFSERYHALPGDFHCANAVADCPGGTARLSTAAAVVNGTGNGIILQTAAATTAETIATGATDAASTEALQFWVHLNVAKLIGGVSPINTAPLVFGEGAAVPATAIPGAGISVNYGPHESTVVPLTTHWLVVHKTPGGAGAALSPKQMYQIDNKTDDGIGATGLFRTRGAGTGCGALTATAADYVPVDETVLCNPEIVLIQ
jgi:prepilin-type N-terminal cleavage/methylation domain-containing protein